MQKEQNLENYLLEELKKAGWNFIEQSQLVRADASEPLLLSTLIRKLGELNKSKRISEDEVQKAVNELKLALTGPEGAKKLLRFYKYGIPLKFEKDGTVNYVSLFDFEKPSNNEFLVSRQVSYAAAEVVRVDLILYINVINDNKVPTL